MAIDVFRATGRAECRICKEKIEKDAISVKFSDWRVNEQYHLDCIRKQGEDLEEAEYVRKEVKSIDLVKIPCHSCGRKFKGMRGKEDTCPSCLAELIKPDDPNEASEVRK